MSFDFRYQVGPYNMRLSFHVSLINFNTSHQGLQGRCLFLKAKLIFLDVNLL